MVIKEYLLTRKDGVKLYRNYSDQNKMILQVETGVEYAEAIDVESAPYTYEETDEDIINEETPEDPSPENDAS